jgi:hypothetical protein
MHLNEMGCGLGLCDSGYGRVTTSYEQGNGDGENAPLKRRSISTRLQGATSQKTVIFKIMNLRVL